MAIETCQVCLNRHETGEVEFGGTRLRMCPEVPEGMLVPLVERKGPELYDADGHRIQLPSYLEIAGFRHEVKDAR